MFCVTIYDQMKGYQNKLNSLYTCFASYENAFVCNIHMNRAFLSHVAFKALVWYAVHVWETINVQ